MNPLAAGQEEASCLQQTPGEGQLRLQMAGGEGAARSPGSPGCPSLVPAGIPCPAAVPVVIWIRRLVWHWEHPLWVPGAAMVLVGGGSQTGTELGAAREPRFVPGATSTWAGVG